MTYQLTVVYGHPEDPAAFDEHYASTHAPLASRVPGLLAYTSHRAEPGPDGSPADHYLVAVLTFPDRSTFLAGFGGPEGQAAARDVAGFATGGATLLSGEVATYV